LVLLVFSLQVYEDDDLDDDLVEAEVGFLDEEGDRDEDEQGISLSAVYTPRTAVIENWRGPHRCHSGGLSHSIAWVKYCGRNLITLLLCIIY